MEDIHQVLTVCKDEIVYFLREESRTSSVYKILYIHYIVHDT